MLSVPPESRPSDGYSSVIAPLINHGSSIHRPACGGSAVGRPDVEALREATQTFRRLDNRFGGGHSRSAVADYLATQVEPKLRHGRSTDTMRRKLFKAAAEMYQLAGWMAYDTGNAADGRTHLRQALRLCQEAQDDGLAAEMLAGMSHHAAFYRAPEVAVDLALAARHAAKQSGIMALQAECAVMEAHGLALRKDVTGSLDALLDAEKAVASAANGDKPAWLGYFDDAYLAAKFAHTFRDLGKLVDVARRLAPFKDTADVRSLYAKLRRSNITIADSKRDYVR